MRGGLWSPDYYVDSCRRQVYNSGVSTLSIVVLSILASLFSLLLIASISALVYANLQLRRKISEFSTTIQSAGVKMDTQFNHIETLIASVHGDRIEKAAEAFLQQVPRQAQLVTRIEKATLLFIDVVKHLQGEIEIPDSAIERARESGLGPESYAPAAPGEHYVSRSRTTALDAEALADEAADHTQSFDEGLQP